MKSSIGGLFKDQFRTAQSSNSMASAESEPITGAEPTVAVRGRSLPEAEWPFVFACSK